jgi:hypothetical protein
LRIAELIDIYEINYQRDALVVRILAADLCGFVGDIRSSLERAIHGEGKPGLLGLGAAPSDGLEQL